MQMKNNNIGRWKDVYNFTLIQAFKNKAFIISFVILIVLSMVSMPIISMLTGRGKTDVNTPSPVKKVYVKNETALPVMDFKEVLKDPRMSRIVFDTMQDDYNVVSKRIEEKENESVILTISESGENYSLNFVKASKGPVTEGGLQALSDLILPQFEAFKINALGIKDEQLAIIHAPVTTKVSMSDANGALTVKEDTKISSSQYWFIYGILFIVMMANVLASTQIASSIVTEKSTRVIEYLLTSVKPLSIMAGKILGMLTAVMLQLISMVGILFISNKVSSALSSGNGESVMSRYLPKDIFHNLSLVNIVFCIVLIVLGIIFYATLAGLTGATVSRIEELQEGLMLFTFTNLIGSYIGIAAAVMLMGKGINAFVIFAFLFPLSSPFILPGAILIGKAGLIIAIAAIILEIIFIILLLKFVAKVYETLILHNGSKIKITELIKISKTV
jgi:ABC-2 type transport system permease protein